MGITTNTCIFYRIAEDRMTRFALLLVLLVGLFVAGVILLSSWHIPAPTIEINKVILDAELSK